MNKDIKSILLKYKPILKEANIETYSLDVEVLLMNVTNFSKTELYLKTDYILTQEQYEKFIESINRRLKKEPIAYILGRCEFMGMDFLLNAHTLIPRPDTEVLVEEAIKIIQKNNFKKVLDIGTGSGAIGISIAKFCADVEVVAIDINNKALEIAKVNAELNNIKNISFLESDIFGAVNGQFDIIVSNPPYIPTGDIDELEDNVKKYEPIIALDGGESGLVFYENIINNASKFLNNGGYLAFEIGYNQAEDVGNFMIDKGYFNVNVVKDLAGLDRVIFSNIK